MADDYNKSNVDGVISSDVNVVVENTPRTRSARASYYDVLLRIIGLACTFIASVIVGVDKERKIIPLKVTDSLPPLQITVIAKWHYMSAFVYFLVSNAKACTYAATSLVFSMMAKNIKNNMALLVLVILDLLIMGLLLSASGAAAAIGVIGLKGNSHVQWRKVCDVFGTYCRHMAAAVVLSLLGSFVFLWLVVLSVLNLQRNSK
ncbi:CASP-like protein [Quillaja saponaria]|uniref:CASP-like protein n=1 Tax=Quillaja saponaria TaxID=32244 RepID=A0AAD7LAY0_QUISA|nr:CASP-like protein [Quillaja saponaria]